MSERFRQLAKDVLLVASVFAAISAAYYGFAVAERYRALTKAYITQAEQLTTILNAQAERVKKP